MARFNGKSFASAKEEELKLKVKKLSQKPKLVSILVGKDKASLLYTKLKSEAAKRVGVNFVIKKFPDTVTTEKLVDEINELNSDDKVNGIMLQLPLPSGLKPKAIINSIDKNKDVDGMKTVSKFTPAAVKAIRLVVQCALEPLAYSGKKAAVIGAKGFVGKGAVRELKSMGYKVSECDIDTRDLYAKLTNVDLIVSATGTPGIIKAEMVKEGVIAIDVGAPVGDLDPLIENKAIFYTPVPGGLGPVTIVCLLENLIDSCKNT